MSSDWLPCSTVPLGVKIAPEGKSWSSSPLFKIEKLSIDPTFEVTTNASLALVESLRIKL